MAKVKKEISAQAKRRLILFAPICLFFIGAFVFSIITYGSDIYQLQQNKNKLDQEYAGLQETAEELKKEITKLQDPEYLARFAREQYLYSKDGELIIKVYETKQAEAAAAEEKKLDRVMIISYIGAVALIFLYIIIRSTKKRSQVNPA